MAYDLVIRDGTVVDGSGAPRFRADVAVSGGRIAAIGRIRERGAEEIDAEGQMVAPGFVEVHTHMDAQVFWDPLGTCSSWHGVTSAVMGNCGFTLAPCRESEKDLVMRNLERAEDISRQAMLAGITWQWETYPEYLDAVERVPKGINYGGYVGHSALRTYVMGERAFEEKATDDDVAEMCRQVEASIRAGALGFTTSRSGNHMTSDDRPVASRAADWDEVRALVGVMGDLGAGIFEMANEAHADQQQRVDYWNRMGDLAVESGRPMTFVIGYSPSTPDLWRQYLRLLDDSARRGGRMIGQVHSREFLSVVGFKVRLPFDGLPAWRELRSRPLEGQRAGLGDADLRARLVDEALHGPYGTAIGAEARAPSYDILRVLDSPEGPWPTVAALAAERGTTPVDVMIDLSLASDFDQLFSQPFANQDLDVVLAMIRHPRTVVGVSDSGRPRLADHGQLDPDLPARPLGPPNRGARLGGRRPHAHLRSGVGVGLARSGPHPGGLRRRPGRLRPRAHRAGTAPRCERPSLRRQAPHPEGHRNQGHGGQRRGPHARRRAHGSVARPAPPGPAGNQAKPGLTGSGGAGGPGGPAAGNDRW